MAEELNQVAAVMNVDKTIDAATVLVGVTMVLVKIALRKFRGQKVIATTSLCTSDMLNGSVLVPFFVIFMAPFSQTALDYLHHTNIAMTSLAGAVGLFYVVGELFTDKSLSANSESAPPAQTDGVSEVMPNGSLRVAQQVAHETQTETIT